MTETETPAPTARELVEYDARDHAHIVDTMGDRMSLAASPGEINLTTHCEDEWTFVLLDRPRVEALRDLLTRFLDTGTLRQEGEGAALGEGE